MKHQVSSIRWSVAVAVLVVLGTLAGGVRFYCVETQRLREDAEANLQAIAQLKTDQIAA